MVIRFIRYVFNMKRVREIVMLYYMNFFVWWRDISFMILIGSRNSFIIRLVIDRDNIRMYFGFCNWELEWMDIRINRFFVIIMIVNKMNIIMMMVMWGLRINDIFLLVGYKFVLFVMFVIEKLNFIFKEFFLI